MRVSLIWLEPTEREQVALLLFEGDDELGQVLGSLRVEAVAEQVDRVQLANQAAVRAEATSHAAKTAHPASPP